MCWNLGQLLWFWVWKPAHSLAGRAICVCVCVCVCVCLCVCDCMYGISYSYWTYTSHKEHRRQEVLVLCLSPQTLSVFHINRRRQAVLPPAHWGERRKQLEKQIVADRLSPSPLALTHDWTFTWLDQALPFFSCSWKRQDRGYFTETKSTLSMLLCLHFGQKWAGEFL